MSSIHRTGCLCIALIALACFGAIAFGQNPATDPGQQPAPQTAIVPLHGSAGSPFETTPTPGSCFDGRLLNAMLAAASDAGANVVVLDINSRSGQTAHIEELLEVLADWRGRLRIVAFVREADGPAAAIAFASEATFVHPAAVVLGPAFASKSTLAARVRARLEAAGRPGAIAEGFVSGKIWQAPSGAFATQPPSSQKDTWRKISDGPRFTATAQRLIDSGIATTASSAEEVASQMSLTIPPADLSRRIRSLQDERVISLRALTTAYTDARDGLSRLGDVVERAGSSGNTNNARRELSQLRASLLRAARTIINTANNPRAPAAVPAGMLCRAEAAMRAVEALPSDARRLSNTAERSSVKSQIGAARKDWEKCEGEG